MRLVAVVVIVVHAACVVAVSHALFWPQQPMAYWGLMAVWSLGAGATYLGGAFDVARGR